MKRYKIIETVTTDNKQTIVKIQTNDGIFTGKSKCHPDDISKNRYSLFVGERYAEIRAVLKWMKYKKKLIKAQKAALTNLLNDIKQNCKEQDFNKNMIKRLYYKINHYNNLLIENNNISITLKNLLLKMEKQREDILNKYEKNNKNTT